MKEKFKKLWQWLRREVLNKRMLLWLVIAEAIFWSPCIAGALLGVFFGPWYFTICAVYVAFWTAPFTPAIPLQIGLAYGLKKLAEACKRRRKRHETKAEREEERDRAEE